MKRLTCEMCGSTDLIKEDGVFVCQSCGCKYSVEEARRMMIEGTVEVTGTVRVDNSGIIENYLDMARNALEAGNNQEADDYCNKIIEINAAHWEAWLIKGSAVGWQSTLGNVRIAETINAFSRALDYCPEEMKEEIGDKCKSELEKLHCALLKVRVDNFKTHPNDNDLQGLQRDVLTILEGTVGFLTKANLLIDSGNCEYGRVIFKGLCDAVVAIYKDFLGDGHPNTYDFKEYIKEGDIILKAFELALMLLGTAYDDQEKNELICQIYEIMIIQQENLRDACAYEISYVVDGVSHYRVCYHLTDQAKNIRNGRISDWQAKIREVKTTGAKKVAEKAAQRREQYWAEHEEERAKLEDEKAALQDAKKDLEAQIQVLMKERNSVPAKAELDAAQSHMMSLSEQKRNLGLFKMKEKKALQEQIDTIQADADEIQKLVNMQQAEVDKRINPLRARLKAVEDRIAAIDREFNMDR